MPAPAASPAPLAAGDTNASLPIAAAPTAPANTNETASAAGDPSAAMTNAPAPAVASSASTATNAGSPAADSTAAAATTAATTATATNPPASSAASLTVGSSSVTTSPVANMDGVVGLDFKNELPVIITKTIASTITKAIAAYAINEAASQQNAYVQLFALITTVAYQAAVNIADTRTWTTLPKEFQVCRFPTPPDRKITLETPDGLQKIPVTIGDGTINIVYVKSITAGGPLLVSQMKLK